MYIFRNYNDDSNDNESDNEDWIEQFEELEQLAYDCAYDEKSGEDEENDVDLKRLFCTGKHMCKANSRIMIL